MTVTDFGDADPEDAYDVNDPPEARYRVLRRWVASVALEQGRGDHDPGRVLARIQQARWAAAVLVASLSGQPKRIVAAFQEWLDDLLHDEQTG